MKFSSGIVIRYALLALANALAVYALVMLSGLGMWKGFVAVLVATAAIDIVYATKRFVPLKYLMPGLVLLLVYQIYVVFYTGAVALTNSSEFNQGTQDRAVDVILAQNERRVPESPQYRLTVLDRRGELAFLVTDPEGTVSVGTERNPLDEVDDATLDDSGKAVALDGYDAVPYTELVGPRAQEVTAYRVPFSAEAQDGSLKTQDGSNAYVYKPAAVYDEEAGTITRDGVVYTADPERGYFVSEDGDRLTPGWKVFVGLDNFTRIPSDVLIARTARGQFSLVLLFAATREDLVRHFSSAAAVIAPKGHLWIAWPKKTSRLAADLTQEFVRAYGLDRLWVDFKICAIDADWSGLKFSRRR